MMTPGRTIRALMCRVAAGEALTRDELRAAGLDLAIEAILEEWSRRGFLTRIVRPSGAAAYRITPLGAQTARWD
jgi:hypothetical protein